MEDISKNRIFEFGPDQLKCVRKQYNLDKPGDMGRAIDVLEEWIKTQKHFMKTKFPRNYLEKAIVGSKGSMERAKSKLDKICTFRTVMPDFFGDNLTKNKFDDLVNLKSVLLPKPTNDNCRVYFIQTTGSKFTSDIITNFYRYIILICEYLMANDYSDGYVVINDYNDADIIELIKALNLTELRQMFTIVTEGFGMRVKGIHLLTPSKAIDMFVSIIKQLISPKIRQRIYVHKDINSLYQYVSKDILPVEFGGKEKSIVKLRDELMNELTGKDFVNYIEDMNEAKTDESCRQTDKFNEHYLDMPGSFRTLNVD